MTDKRHDFVPSDDPDFGSFFGGGCAADLDGTACGWPRMAPIHGVVTTVEEWRVTGDPGPEFGPYHFVWSSRTGLNPERPARAFMAMVAPRHDWVDGPHLHRRTVTFTEWEPVDPAPEKAGNP